MADLPKRPTTNIDDTATFPVKLRQILSNPELSHIISWLHHGYSWKIHDPTMFVDVVMPRYFEKQSKLTSFTRQVNGWGFKRVTQGIDRNAYYNEFFLRDYPHLMSGMKRRRIGDQDSHPGVSDFSSTNTFSSQPTPVIFPMQRFAGIVPHRSDSLAVGDVPSGSGYRAYPLQQSSISSSHFLPKIRTQQSQKGNTGTGSSLSSKQNISMDNFASYPGFQYENDNCFESFGYDMQRQGKGQLDTFDMIKENGESSDKKGHEGSAINKETGIISPIPLSRSNMRRSTVPDEICSADANGLALPEFPVSSMHNTAYVTNAINAGEAATRNMTSSTQKQELESKRNRKEAESDKAHINSLSDDDFKIYIKGRLNF